MWLNFSNGVENEGAHRLDFFGHPDFLENQGVRVGSLKNPARTTRCTILSNGRLPLPMIALV